LNISNILSNLFPFSNNITQCTFPIIRILRVRVEIIWGEGVETDFVRGLRCQKDRETLLFLTSDAVKIGETKHLGVQNQMNFY
jgi:hypothetical protein